MFCCKHFYAGDDEYGAKNVQEPSEPLYKCYTHGDEYYPEHDGHQYADKQHACRVLVLHPEEGEQQDEHKNIINAQ